MENKNVNIISSILWCVGILLLLAGAFDVLPIEDNKVMFAGIACFIISVFIKKISKGSCCK
jgi:hypothetical protein